MLPIVCQMSDFWMVRNITVIVLLLISWDMYSQDLKGFVADQSSHQPLHGAHVLNFSSKLGATTTSRGAFTIPATIGDTILITFVGYADYPLVVKEKNLLKPFLVLLEEKEVTLDDIVVTPFSEYPQKPVIELDSLEAIILYLPDLPLEYDYDPREAPIPDKMAPTFGVGFRFDLEKFTKRRKEKTHFTESRDRDQKWKIAELKFNREWLTEITKLEGDALTYFIAYCDFSVDYLAQASIIDLQDHVLAKLEKYQLETKPR